MITMTISTSTTFVDFVNTTLNDDLTTTTSLWIQILTLTCMILIDISAFFGNLLVICAFFRTRRLQTVTNYFIASLAFADALVAIFVLPLSIYYYQRDRSWELGLILCDLWVSSDVLLCTSSILNLTCISVDRYMAITRPLTYTAYRSKFLARVMILLVWIVSAVITCPPIFGWRDSNRRQTVEHEHKCDLNTARGYVVYSALGSFYIPAVVMIFVYIRIFMVVYDRENLINKFHDNNNNNKNKNTNLSTQMPLKSNQNGLTNAKNPSDDSNDNPNNSINKTKKSFCCCSCRRTKSQENHPTIPHRISLPLINNNCSNIERKQNGYLIYRFTNHHNNSSINSAPAPFTSSSSISKPTFCRPCTISRRKMTTLSDKISNYRRNYLSHIGAEYQFRTDDSPCYELKKFQISLPPLIKCRSHSFEQSLTNQTCDLNISTKFNDKQQNEITNILLSEKESLTSPTEHCNEITQSLNELSDDITQLSMNKQTKTCEIDYSNNSSKHSRTILPKSSSSIDQNLTNSLKFSNIHDSKSIPEQTRINRRMKPLRSTPSTILVENIKQQHKISQNTNSSLKSNLSLASIRRINENDQKNSKSSSCCCCCFPPLNKSYENKNKQITPNHSLTNDDDEDEKLSSNDLNTRVPIISPSNPNLRAVEHSNSNNVLSSSHHPSTSGIIPQNPSSDVHRRERIRFMKEQKTAKTLAVVVGGFILFWLPFFIMYIIPPQTFSFNAQTVTLITWLGYFNSVINPFIYAYCSKQFRMAFWNITFGMCIKKSNALLPISVKNKQIHRRHINA